MGLELAKAYVTVRGDTSKFAGDIQSGQSKMTSAMSGLAGKLQGIMAMVGAGIGIQQLFSLFRESIPLIERQVDAEQKVAAVIKATGGAAGYTAEELKKWASELQRVTTIGDEATLEAAAKLLTFKSVTGDVFKSAMESAADLAAGGFGSMESAATMLGLALESPAIGLTRLRRVGVSFSDAQREQIKQLVAAGRLHEAQMVLLAGVREQVGGVAKEMAKTPVGVLRQLRNTLGDVKETLGKELIPVVQAFTKAKIKMVQVIAGFAKVIGSAISGLGEYGQVIVVTTVAVSGLTAAFYGLRVAARLAGVSMKAALIGTGIGAILVAIGVSLGVLITWLRRIVRGWQENEAMTARLSAAMHNLAIAWERIKQIGLMVMNALITVFQQIAQWLGFTAEDFQKLPDTISEAMMRAVEWVSNFVMQASEWVIAFLENWRAVWDALPGIVTVALSYMVDVFTNWLDILPQITGYVLRKAFDAFLWFSEKVLGLMFELVKGIFKLFLSIPELLVDVLSGRDVSEQISRIFLDALSDFGKGLKGEAPDMTKLLVPSDHTIGLAKRKLGDAYGKIAESKKKLEINRKDLFPEKPGEVAKDKPKKMGEEVGKAAAASMITDLRIGLPDLGRKVQDALLKAERDQKGGDKQEQMVNLLDAGNKKQDELIDAVKDQDKVGRLG